MGIIIKTIKRSYSSDMRKEDDIIPIIKDFMERYDIIDYTINPDKSVDVNDSIDIYPHDLIDGKIPFKFSKVSGWFACQYNKLTSLKGCPEKVGGGFFCQYNQLTSLEGCPKEVGGTFDCSNNKLTSLEGCPKKVGGGFYCDNNELTSLEGCPKEVGYDFECGFNKTQFTSEEVKQYCEVKGKIWVL